MSYKNKGFTLVELIVVIVILGILAAAAMPKFIEYRTNARIAALNGMVGALRTIMGNTQAAYYAFPANRKSVPPNNFDYWNMYLELNDTTKVIVNTSWWTQRASIGLPIAGKEGLAILLNCSSLGLKLTGRYNCGGYTATNMVTTYNSYTDNASANIFPPGVTPDITTTRPITPRCFVNYSPGHTTSSFEPSVTMVTDDC